MNNKLYNFSLKLKNRNFQRWRSPLYIIGLVVGGIFFAYQLYFGITSIFTMKLTFDKPILILLSLCLSIAITFFQMLLWKKLMQELGVSIHLKNVIKGYELSFLPRYIPGSIWGYASRSEWLHKEFNVAPEITNIGSALEIILLLVSNLGWSLSGFLFTGWYKWVLPIISPIASVLFLVILRILLKSVNSIINITPKLIITLGKIRLTSWFFLSIQMVLFWALQGLTLLIILYGFSILSPLSFSSAINHYFYITGSYCLAWVVGFLVFFIPSGIGVRERILSKQLQENFSFSFGISSYASTFMRICLALGELFWILFALIISKSTRLFGLKPN